MGVKIREKIKGSGEWWVFVYYAGKYTSRKIGDKKAAIQVAKRLQAELPLASFNLSPLPHKTKSDDTSFGSYAMIWVETRARLSLKKSTHHGYRLIIQKHLIPKFGKIPLSALTSMAISAYILSLYETGMKSRTIRNIKNCLSTILQSAVVDDGVLSVNPARGIRVPSPEGEEATRHPNPFTFDERAHFERMTHERSPGLIYPITVIGFRMGLRIGEILALKIGDIDFFNHNIHITRSIGRDRVTTPKSRASVRIVRMSPEAEQVVHQQIVRIKEFRLAKGWGTEMDWLFPTPSGGHYTYSGLIKAWNVVMEASGMLRRTPHDLRHTYATLRLSMGHPLAEVAKEMGHSNAKVTYETYYKWMPSESASDISEIDSKPSRTVPIPSQGKKR
ncbi:tyrosine-type recombinase/integrase [Desulfatirhabdium butyrativorans]|uniref:tyrosine-type recombinase/integrase n=1 Tax=Desulfatirhabdium butyrativorans TaxID=340467 RepID=UPI00040BBAF7|nr:site-specific integrase [Desulfatirhabdium butyrativorans]